MRTLQDTWNVSKKGNNGEKTSAKRTFRESVRQKWHEKEKKLARSVIEASQIVPSNKVLNRFYFSSFFYL